MATSDESPAGGSSAPTPPQRAVTMQTAAHGPVAFDFALPAYREQLLRARVPEPAKVSPAHFVDAVAVACVSALAGREYRPDDSDEDERTVRSLSLVFSPEERAAFATKFLEFNDHLLCDIASEDDGDVSGVKRINLRLVPKKDVTWKENPVERLHQAWQIHEAEQAALLEQMFGPLQRIEMSFLDLDRKMSRWLAPTLATAELTRTTERVGRALDPFGHGTVARAVDTMRGMRRMDSQLQLVSGFDRYLKMWRRLGDLAGVMTAFNAARSLSTASFTGLLGRLAEMDLLRDSALGGRLLRPSMKFVGFLEDTAKLAESAPPSLQSVLEKALTLGSDHFQRTNEIAARMLEHIERPQVEQLPSDLESQPLDLLAAERDDLIARAEKSSAMPDELAAASVPVQIATLVQEVLHLVLQCNETAVVRNGTEIFKPTTRVMASLVYLPQRLPADRSSFGDAVDDLYVLLYEGAAEGKRLVDLPNTPFKREDEAAKGLFRLKFLRSKWLRHDIEHGSSADIQRARQTIRETLQQLGMSTIPISAADFQSLYVHLLGDLRRFLEELLERLRR